ncbi:MAG: PadR family transcriptional regulator [Geodermatophilaceae bacterium]|nr:PadR family transcriptional regulator [Geodermatophilaceae bacterium]
MSIRYGLLALLRREPMYGYQLRGEFETSTGGTWPLNIGQVYTTLSRLERDGCVVGGVPSDDDHGEPQKTYSITVRGLDELTEWFTTPVSRAKRPRDELAIKLAMALVVPGVDVPRVIQAQRTDTLRALQDFTRLKVRAGDDDLSWLLVLDSMIFGAEAEVRWLDHCESRLARHRRAPTPVGTPVTAVTAPSRTVRSPR